MNKKTLMMQVRVGRVLNYHQKIQIKNDAYLDSLERLTGQSYTQINMHDLWDFMKSRAVQLGEPVACELRNFRKDYKIYLAINSVQFDWFTVSPNCEKPTHLQLFSAHNKQGRIYKSFDKSQQRFSEAVSSKNMNFYISKNAIEP